MNRGRDDGGASGGPTVIVDDEREPGGFDHGVDVDVVAGLGGDVRADEGLVGRPVEGHLHLGGEQGAWAGGGAGRRGSEDWGRG